MKTLENVTVVISHCVVVAGDCTLLRVSGIKKILGSNLLRVYTRPSSLRHPKREKVLDWNDCEVVNSHDCKGLIWFLSLVFL